MHDQSPTERFEELMQRGEMLALYICLPPDLRERFLAFARKLRTLEDEK